MREPRNLVVVLGDQLDAASSAFDGFDPESDRVFMAEVSAEGEHVWSHKARIALFLSAMRHFREGLRARGLDVVYVELAESTPGAELAKAVERLRPERVVVVEPGEWRVREELLRAVPSLEIRPDRHFLCPAAEFEAWAKGRKQLGRCVRPSPSLPTRRRARSSTSWAGASPRTPGASTASTGR